MQWRTYPMGEVTTTGCLSVTHYGQFVQNFKLKLDTDCPL